MKVFNKDFTIEDLILYFFGIGIMVFLGLFLIQAQQQLNFQVVGNTNEDCVADSDDFNVQITQLKYDYASKILLSNSTRKNIAFLVGTILAIFGCMIVIRGVRESPIEGELTAFEKANIKIKTSSPGIMIVLCGCFIIALSIFVKDKYDIRDPYIPPSIYDSNEQDEGRRDKKPGALTNKQLEQILLEKKE